MLSRARNYIQRIAKVSNNIINHIPNQNDNLPTKVIKIISLIDTAQEFVYGKRDPVKEYLSQYNPQRKNNQAFVFLFFSNLVIDHFDVARVPISNDVILLIVDVPGNGELYFVERKYDNYTEQAEDFYHSPGFDFKSFMDLVWELYDGRIYVTLNNKNYRWNPGFSTFPVSSDPIYGSAKNLLKKIGKKNSRAKADGVSRSYMFFGPPGSGKSSFAQKLGAESNKVIKFDAKSIDVINVESISFLLGGLMPEFVIIDDIDKVIFGSSVATLLCILETVKLEFPNATIIVTASKAQSLDPSLLRAGRLDEPIQFNNQDKNDRRQILCNYADQLKVEVSKKQINKIVKRTEGLSAAYMKEIIIQMKYSSMEDVLNIIDTMKFLLGADEDEDGDGVLTPKKRKSKKPKKRKSKKHGWDRSNNEST